MKKLMILAVAAIALVACSKEFDTNKSASNSAAIGFNTWAEQLTKARDAGSSTFVSGDYFLVSGFKTKSTTYTEVFANDTVKFNGSVWSYDNPRYWDSGADSYTFYYSQTASINDAARIREITDGTKPIISDVRLP